MFSVLIIGFGGIAKRHIQNLYAHFDIANLCVVKSTSVNVDDEFVKQHNNIHYYYDLNAALNKHQFDFACICSPANYHVEQAITLINSGIPCFIEKPISHNLEQTQTLQSFAKTKGISFCVGYDLRFTKGFTELHRLLSCHTLGSIWRIDCQVGQYLPDWRPDKHYVNTVSAQKVLGGGVLRELSHELDYLLGLFRFNTIQSKAHLFTHPHLDMDCENEALIVATAATPLQEQPVSMTIKLDFLQRIPSRFLIIEAQYGYVKWDLLEQTITLNHVTEGETRIDVSEVGNDVYVNEIRAFIRSLNNGFIDEQPVKDSINVLRWIEAIECSNEQPLQI